MTLIAVHAAPERATIMYDQLHYNGPGTYAEIVEEPKAWMLPGLAAATACAGDFKLATAWREQADRFARLSSSFDDFLVAFSGQAPDTDGLPELLVWVAGFSEARGRFVAFEAVLHDGFVFEEASDRLSVMPMPPGFRPSPIEQRARAGLGLPLLDDGLVYGPPTCDMEWAELAEDIHDGRAATLDPDLKVLMGGAVTLLEVTCDGSRTRVVHTFDERDHAAMLRGTIHASQQLGPCICGSGVRMLDCHLPEVFDNPCVCGSGLTFAGCCRVEPVLQAVT